MTASVVVIAYFVFTLGAIGLAGYVFVLRPARTGPAPIPAQIALDRSGDLPTAQAVFVDAFRALGDAMPGAKSQAATVRQQLIAAGFRWPSAVSIFFGVKGAFALLLAVGAGWIGAAYRNDPTYAFLPAICGLGFGYLLPDNVLRRMAQRRSERLRRALPAALDLMVLAIEAGQGLDAAIIEASRGLRITYPDLAAEFTQLQLELKADTTRADALRNFAERSRDLELRKFANLLIDTDRFGTSLGPALRTHARFLRIRFRQLAQERARKVGVKLIFPVFFLVFPSVILVTLGPAVILIFQQMKNLLGP